MPATTARDASGRQRAGAALQSGGPWLQLASSADHTLQATDRVTFEATLYYNPSGTAENTIAGYETAGGNSGWNWYVENATGAVGFRVYNNAGTGATYVGAQSAGGALVSGHYYRLAVTVDMNTPAVNVYVNGVLATSTTSGTGSYTATAAPVALTGLLQSGSATAVLADHVLFDFTRTRHVMSSTALKTRGAVPSGL